MYAADGFTVANGWTLFVKTLMVACALFLGALSVSGCTSEPDQEVWLARVGDETITRGAFEKRLRMARRELGDIPVLSREDRAQLHKRLLNELIAESLLVQEARRRGLSVDDRELTSEAVRLRGDLDERAWKRYLLEHYVDERDWERTTRRRLLVERLLAQELARTAPVTEADIDAHYRESFEAVNPGIEVELWQIVVADEQEARALRKELLGGRDFAELAREHSIGPERTKGGRIGYVRAEDLPESFAPAFRLPVGKVSKVIQTEYGYHVFRVTDRRRGHRPDRKSVERMIRETIERERLAQIRQQLIDRLRQEVPIEINDDEWARALDVPR